MSKPITVTIPALSSSSAVYTIQSGGGGGGGSAGTYGGGYPGGSASTHVHIQPNTTPNLSYSYTTNGAWQNALSGTSLVVQSDAEIKGNLIVDGKDVMKLLDKIEERLAILHPNTELEERWEELKELSKRYRELEAEIIEKEKVWAILQK
jgi:hypothetical protein